MAKKNIAVTISSPPHGKDNVMEGLRMAVGLCAGVDEHQVSVIFCGDGVYNVLSDVQRDETSIKCWDMLKKLNLKLFVDGKSMEENGVLEADMDDPIKIVKRADIVKILGSSDIHLDF
ncbi:MAG: hypothetical protein A2161_12440 [Candidatus Schekmanbacteria bacterium RBG_13_48_7]|uniref:Uncharacterized protein n=1 Tax=Candidatus Schekmanbacteria bacterium RBG_13_48_7 TaxID=1817878 RepID=A0A1F7RKD1_9BACT|nr:MAG: hypothetical protein A2161_12440 [Candidatus Schekmanbacteria bacterium RBG_13_48_7]